MPLLAPYALQISAFPSSHRPAVAIQSQLSLVWWRQSRLNWQTCNVAIATCIWL